MGYKVGSLASLPIINGGMLYVFVLGNIHWKGGGIEKIAQNFDLRAKELGPRGAIVMGHEGVDLSYELIQAMYDNGPDGIQEMIHDGNRHGGALLITNKYPTEIEKTDPVLFAPIDQLEKRAGGIDRFFNELCEYARKPNEDFIRLFSIQQKGFFGRLLKVVDLKPNIAGIGLNLNALLEDDNFH